MIFHGGPFTRQFHRRDTSSGQRRPIKTCWLWMVPKKLDSNLHLARADLISRHMASGKFGPLLFPEPFIGRTYGPQPSPHFSDEREGLRQRFILSYEFSEAGDEWPQAGLGHVGYQLVEHAALPEQRMGSAFGGVDLEMTIHA